MGETRKATFAPSLQEISLKEMMRVWNLYSTQSIAALLKTLNLDIVDYKYLIDKYDIVVNEPIEYPWLDRRVQQLFDDAMFREKLWQHVIYQRKLLKDYLMTKSIIDDYTENVCIVDVGWRGTIHDNIALLFPGIHFTGVYLGLQKYLKEQPSNISKSAFGLDLNKHHEYPHFLDSVAPIEMITNSPFGSVTGYQYRKGSIIAVRNINNDENEAWHKFTRTYQKGILSGMKSFSHVILDYGLDHSQIRSYALKTWNNLIIGNNHSLTETFNNLNHNETFGVGGYIRKIMPHYH